MKGWDRRLECRLFLILFMLNAGLFAFLILDRRMVRGHDTFQYYTTQYYFAANAAQGGGVPWWLPSLSQGTASSWHQAWQGGLFQNVLLAAGPFFRGVNFLPLFYLGLFLDELLFLSGVWLLSRRMYSSPYTVFFVSIASTGSCLWADQIWHNFHALYALPLILFWLHEFMDTGRRMKLFLASALFILQLSGNLPYTPLLSALVLLIYAVSGLILHRRRQGSFEALRPRPTDPLWLAPIVLFLGVAYLSLKSGSDLNIIQTVSREADGTTRLDGFLTYGGFSNPIRYLEFLHGVSPSLDYTLFCGFFIPAFAALAFLLRPGRRTLHLGSVAVITLLFSCGFLSMAAPAAFSLVPGFRYFRHVALAAPFVKLFVIFLAGLGFERSISRFRFRPGWSVTTAFFFLGLAGILGSIALSGAEAVHSFFDAIRTGMPETYSPPHAGRSDLLRVKLLLSGITAAATGLLFLLAGRTKGPRIGWMAILVFHAVQLFGWKFQMLREKTLALNPEQYAMQTLTAIPYQTRRSRDYEANPRYALLRKEIFDLPYDQYGTIHWTTDSYLFMDAPSSRFRTSDWMTPFDELLRAYEGKAIRDRRQALSSWDRWVLSFPSRHPASPKVIGQSVDKLQIFSQAHPLPTSEEIAKRLTDPAFEGDLLFLQGPVSTPPVPLDGNERIDVPIEVLEFDANHLRIRTRVPQKAWLLYCDVWHPGWSAKVNGHEVPVERAQIAYKAVSLEAGENVVDFRFSSPIRAACFIVTSMVSFLALGVLLSLGATLLGVRPRNPVQSAAPWYD